MDEDEYSSRRFEKYFKSIAKASPTKQLCVGAASGWCTGFLSMKFGKLSAICVGSSIILLHYAQHNNYVTINWKKVNKDLEKITEKAEEKIAKQGSEWMEKISLFAKENTFLLTGFVGGFFIGAACS